MSTVERSRRLGGLLLATMIVAGCGSSTTSTAPSASAAPTTAPGDASSAPTVAPPASAAVTACMSGDKVNLNLWIFEGEEEILTDFKAGFEASHPSCTLEITLIPEDSYVTKLDTAFAAGSPPDVAYVYEPRWQKAGAFLPLDDIVASRGIDLTRYSQGPLGLCQVEGKLVCIGSYLGAVVLLYDKAAFDAAGLPYPSATVPMSVDQYRDLAAKLAKPDPDLAKRVWGAEVATSYWWMDPLTLFSQDGQTATGFVDDDATIHSWQVLGAMGGDGTAITSTDIEAAGTESADLLAGHRLAMAIGDSVAVSDLEAKEGVQFGVAPVPVERDGDATWVPTWTDLWGVPVKSAHAAEAQELVAWIATEGAKIRLDHGTLPLDLQLAAESGWADGHPARQQLLDLVKLAKAGPFIPGLFSALGGTFEDTFAAIVAGGDASSALQDVAPLLQQDLDQQWQTWNAIQ